MQSLRSVRSEGNASVDKEEDRAAVGETGAAATVVLPAAIAITRVTGFCLGRRKWKRLRNDDGKPTGVE